MRRVAWWLLFVGACAAGPASEARNPPESGGSEEVVPSAANSNRQADDEDDELLLGALGSPAAPTPAPAPAPAPAPPSPLLPLARHDRGPTPSVPELASAEATYARLLTAHFGLTAPPSTAEAGIRQVIGRIQTAYVTAHEVSIACGPIEQSAAPLRVSALLLHADAFDFLGSRTEASTLPLPADLAHEIRRASPDVRAEIAQEFHDRIAAALSPQARGYYCEAALLYQQVLTVDPANARATEQLASYGPMFVQSCGP